MHEAALRLFPESPYAKEHTAPKGRRSSPEISAVEKSAHRIMHKLYEPTGGQPQRCESLGDLGAVKADAVGIAYAVEMDWLLISDGFHSVSLTDAGRRRVESR